MSALRSAKPPLIEAQGAAPRSNTSALAPAGATPAGASSLKTCCGRGGGLSAAGDRDASHCSPSSGHEVTGCLPSHLAQICSYLHLSSWQSRPW